MSNPPSSYPPQRDPQGLRGQQRPQQRPLDYRTAPPPDARSGLRTVLRVLFWIFVTIVVLFFVLLGTCMLMMRR